MWRIYRLLTWLVQPRTIARAYGLLVLVLFLAALFGPEPSDDYLSCVVVGTVMECE